MGPDADKVLKTLADNIANKYQPPAPAPAPINIPTPAPV